MDFSRVSLLVLVAAALLAAGAADAAKPLNCEQVAKTNARTMFCKPEATAMSAYLADGSDACKGISPRDECIKAVSASCVPLAGRPCNSCESTAQRVGTFCCSDAGATDGFCALVVPA